MYHNINYCFHVSEDDDEEAKMKKVLQAEKARAALVFERKCQTGKSTKQNGNQQNDKNKKKQKKTEKVSESPKKGKSFICKYFRLRYLTCLQLSLPH